MHRMSGVVLRAAAAALLLSAAARAGEPYKRWAVIASPELAKSGLTDLMTVQLSQVPGIEVIERQQLDAALRELRLDAATGEADIKTRLQLGRLIRVDAFVLLNVVTNPPDPAVPLQSRSPFQGPDKPTVNKEEAEDYIRIVIDDCRQGVRLCNQAVRYDPRTLEPTARSIIQQVQQVRGRFPAGVREIIGVSPFICRNLTHEYDRYQALFADLLQNALANAPGVAAIEVQQARAIRQEHERAQGPGVDRVIPVFVEGEYEVADGATGGTYPSPSTRPAGQAVRMAIRILDSAGQMQTVRRHLASLDAAIQLLTTDLPSEILQAAGAPNVRIFGLQEQFQSLVSRADVFAAFGAWEQAVDLREAAILLEPGDPAQRLRVAREYLRLLKSSRMHVPPGRSQASVNPAALSQEARRVAWQACREHVEHLVRNKQVTISDATWLAEDVCTLWSGWTRLTDREQTAQREQERRQYLLDFFPRILLLQPKTPADADREYRLWQFAVMELTVRLPITESRVLTFAPDDADFALRVMQDVIPPQRLHLADLTSSLYLGPTVTRLPEYRKFLDRVAESDNRAIAFCGRCARLSPRLEDTSLYAFIDPHAGKVSIGQGNSDWRKNRSSWSRSWGSGSRCSCIATSRSKTFRGA